MLTDVFRHGWQTHNDPKLNF